VIAIEYRKAPEYPFPQPLDDCYHALLWIFENNLLIGFDTKRVGVIGTSAGGNLAAGLSVRIHSCGGFPHLKFQILLCAPLDSGCSSESYKKNGNKYLALTRTSMKWFWKLYLREKSENLKNPEASPVFLLESVKKNNDNNNNNKKNVDLQKFWPETFVVTAGLDPLADDGKQFVKNLLDLNAKSVKYLHFENMTHGFDLNPFFKSTRKLYVILGKYIRQKFGLLENNNNNWEYYPKEWDLVAMSETQRMRLILSTSYRNNNNNTTF